MAIFGWIGSFCLAVCGMPQALQAWRQGHSDGISPLFVWLWFTGEVSFLIYVPFEVGLDLPILVNLSVNFLVCIVILKYIYFPKRVVTL